MHNLSRFRMLTDPTVPAFGLGNNGPNIGSNGTPVIDLPSNIMYAIIDCR